MNEPKMQRVVVYIDKDEHQKLKYKLALLGQTVSEWFRIIIKKFLEQ